MPKKKTASQETDPTYILKILLYFVLGLVWIKVAGHNVFPIGALLGGMIAQQDHFAIDRKIEYVVILIAAILSFIGYGFFLNIQSLSTL